MRDLTQYTIITNESATLGGGAAFEGTGTFQVGPTTANAPLGGAGRVRGFARSDVAGQVELYWSADRADLAGFSANAFLDTLLVASPDFQVSFDLPIRAPFVRPRYLNGAGAQARFRFVVMVYLAG